MSEETLDRGDELNEEQAAATEPEDTSAEPKGTEEEQIEAELEAKKGEEPPRDAAGKFTKKERDDEPRIPKKEFDQRLDKERSAREAAEARLAEAEALLKKDQQSEQVSLMEAHVEKLESQHAKLLLDGEAEQAAAVMKQIRQTERQIARMESDDKVAAATSQAVEQVRMDAVIARLESEYSFFNPDSESFDQDLVDIVLAEQARLIRVDRVAPSAALQRAATKIVAKMQHSAPPPVDQKGLAAAKDGDRKAAQVSKNLTDSKRQPPSLKDAGLDSDKAGKGPNADVSTMTADEWDALPEATKAKLRGDSL